MILLDPATLLRNDLKEKKNNPVTLLLTLNRYLLTGLVALGENRLHS